MTTRIYTDPAVLTNEKLHVAVQKGHGPNHSKTKVWRPGVKIER